MIPKVELHCHVEGTITPELALKLGQKNGVNLDGLIDQNGIYNWSNFSEFISCFDGISQVIKTPADYTLITEKYLEDSAKEGVIYTELFISDAHARSLGMTYKAMLDGIIEGINLAKKSSGIECRLIPICIRHIGKADALKVVKEVIRHPHPLVTGFGIAGDERIHPIKDFEQVFKLAHEAGLRCTAHSGELLGPKGIKDTLTYLPVERLGHGVRAIEDEGVIELLKEKDIVLEVCPSSNVELNVFKSLEQHSFKQLYNKGLKLTISSDDPPFFYTNIGEEYKRIQKTFAFTDQEMINFSITAINAAFVDPITKQQLLDSIALAK